MKGELYDFFDRSSWTDDLEDDELVSLFSDPPNYKCEQSSTAPRRVNRVDLLMKDELYDFFDRSSWTDDLEGDELELFFSGPLDHKYEQSSDSPLWISLPGYTTRWNV